MKRIIKILGIATVLSALLVVSIGGAALAAGEGGAKLQNNTQSQSSECVCDGECLSYGECTCGENAPNLWGETEEPGPHGVGAVYNYNGSGPNGAQNCKGQD